MLPRLALIALLAFPFLAHAETVRSSTCGYASLKTYLLVVPDGTPEEEVGPDDWSGMGTFRDNLLLAGYHDATGDSNGIQLTMRTEYTEDMIYNDGFRQIVRQNCSLRLIATEPRAGAQTVLFSRTASHWVQDKGVSVDYVCSQAIKKVALPTCQKSAPPASGPAAAPTRP